MGDRICGSTLRQNKFRAYFPQTLSSPREHLSQGARGHRVRPPWVIHAEFDGLLASLGGGNFPKETQSAPA
jgi:hypothetical protein